jgi:hypothetical protein
MVIPQKKIALIGSAPSSVDLAPWGDASWEIWGCSPGAWPHAKRVNRWFELHKWEPSKPWFSSEYINFMSRVQGPVLMIDAVADVPNSVAYPKDEMLKRFGPYFFASSLSWMFAMAIAEGATEISLWGVDMSATEEWVYQRSGCHYFIHLAKSMGIKVWTPVESDLMRPPPLYGFSENTPEFGKLLARKQEIQGRMQDAIRREAGAHDERMFLQGALDDIDYHMKTWIADPLAIEMVYQQPARCTNPFAITTEAAPWPDEPPKQVEVKSEPEVNKAKVSVPTKAKRKHTKKPNGAILAA